MLRNLLLIVTCMLIADWANVLLKLGAQRDGFHLSISKVFGIVKNPYLVAGFLAYGLGSVLWLTVLSKNRFSAATVWFSLHYLHLMLLSRLVFKEEITWNAWLGAGFIVVGVACFSLPQLQKLSF